MVSSGENMGKVLNYFLSVFTKENKNIVPVCEQIFSGD